MVNLKRRKAINEMADIIREALKLNTPVPVENIPRMLGGKLSFLSELDQGMEAMITKRGEEFEISIKEDVYPLRQRFSIAHELGHLVLHMGYLSNNELWRESESYKDIVYYRNGFSIEEVEANEFAGALLMPEEEFVEVAEDNLYEGVYALEPIARHFQVSVDAVKVRGRWLGLFN